MSHTDTYTNYATAIKHSKAQNGQSLLSKIITGLKAISISWNQQIHTRSQHQSFMDANLLDEAMGKEISRTLRR